MSERKRNRRSKLWKQLKAALKDRGKSPADIGLGWNNSTEKILEEALERIVVEESRPSRLRPTPPTSSPPASVPRRPSHSRIPPSILPQFDPVGQVISDIRGLTIEELEQKSGGLSDFDRAMAIWERETDPGLPAFPQSQGTQVSGTSSGSIPPGGRLGMRDIDLDGNGSISPSEFSSVSSTTPILPGAAFNVNPLLVSQTKTLKKISKQLTSLGSKPPRRTVQRIKREPIPLVDPRRGLSQVKMIQQSIGNYQRDRDAFVVEFK